MEKQLLEDKHPSSLPSDFCGTAKHYFWVTFAFVVRGRE
jgi:hypothetical protein